MRAQLSALNGGGVELCFGFGAEGVVRALTREESYIQRDVCMVNISGFIK